MFANRYCTILNRKRTKWSMKSLVCSTLTLNLLYSRSYIHIHLFLFEKYHVYRRHQEGTEDCEKLNLSTPSVFGSDKEEDIEMLDIFK